MDYFQGVVAEFLRANRSTFINTECLLQLQPGDAPAKGEHWYCDVVSVNFQEETVYLCEVTYSKTMHSLLARLAAWSKVWSRLTEAIVRDCHVPPGWRVQPWVFIPSAHEDLFNKKMTASNISADALIAMPMPRITHLERVVPWNYPSWNRTLEDTEDKAY